MQQAQMRQDVELAALYIVEASLVSSSSAGHSQYTVLLTDYKAGMRIGA